MISAIREIGRWQRNKYGKAELDTLIREPKFKDGGKVVLIKIDIDKSVFECVELEEYDSAKVLRYLFRGGVSQGPNPTPVANIPNAKKGKSDEETHKNLESQIRKTFEGKIQKWFEKYTKNSEEKDFLENIKKILADNKDKIITETLTLIKNIDKKEGKLLTIKIKKNNEWKYIGDFEIFRESLKEIEIQKTIEISASNKDCSICGVRKALVSGDSGVFKFYTIDKPGFITGGFNESLAWKNFPVCPECKLELEEGRKFIEKNLSYVFYGLSYFLIPKVLLGSINNSEVISILLDSSKAVSLKDRVKKKITSDNNDILEILAGEKDILTLNFLFLSKVQSAERILLLIEDIFPSRIKKIFEAKDYVDSVFNNDSDKGFTFGTIRTFFSKSSEGKRESDLDKYFLEIVDSVFRGRELDFDFLLKFYMATIRKKFINDDYFMQTVKDALMDTIFFENLELINFKEVKDMEKSIFDPVFERYGKSFENPAKRGVFLLGALTQLLLNKQWAERNAKPFMKKLKGLKMDEKDIKALLPEVQNKLEEYDSFDKGKRLIASEASKYLLEAGEVWRMPVDEINFYFACGMNLADGIELFIQRKIIKRRNKPCQN